MVKNNEITKLLSRSSFKPLMTMWLSVLTSKALYGVTITDSTHNVHQSQDIFLRFFLAMKLHYRAVRCCHHLYVLGPCLKHVWKLHIGKRQSAWKKRQICYPSQCLQICLFICLELAPKEKVVMRILAAPQCNRPSPKFSSVLTLEYVKSGFHLI